MRLIDADRMISIHTPREGSDAAWQAAHRGGGAFLSTLPARGATQIVCKRCGKVIISIHTPREGSDMRMDGQCYSRPRISIHTPREGSDSKAAGAATKSVHISIHTPREGSDGWEPSG